MRKITLFRLAIVASCSLATVACQSRSAATDGSGYQLTRFSNPQAARLAAEDETAGPAILSNNQQCRQDPACRK